MPHSHIEAGGSLLHLRVANEPAALEPARRAMLDFLDGQGLSPKLLFNAELVLEETLMNRLWHAFPGGGRHFTDLSLQLRPDVLVLRFEDDGVAFDPLRAPTPVVPASIEAAVPGGLGLLLTRKAASAWHYERAGGRNCFTVQLGR